MFAFVGVLIALVVVWVCVAATGHTARNYTVATDDAKLVLHGDTLTAACIAAIYAPHIYTSDRNDDHTEALEMWYEVVMPQGKPNDVLLVYHTTWRDEIHPDPVIHTLYRTYRAARYGTHDIEFVQIGVNTLDGTIRQIITEARARSKAFATGSQQHLLEVTMCHLDAHGSSYTRTCGQGKEKVVEPQFPLLLDDRTHVRLGVVSWNHLTSVCLDSTYRTLEPFHLAYLDDATYRREKMSRRSNADRVVR